MIVCVDVDYRTDGAVAACVAFEHWTDARPSSELVAHIDQARPYAPGEFYKRELPCLLAVLEKAPAANIVVIDGYVWLAKDRPGLGKKLSDAMNRSAAVVGVAKTAFRGNDAAIPVLRGTSSRPLFVTAEGMAAEEAASAVRSMFGPHRIPTLLSRVDRLCREQ